MYIKGETLKEDLSNLAHEQWSGWMKYLFEKSTKNDDGTVTIPAWAVERWERQVNTPYEKLSEDEQNSDRNEASKFLDVIKYHNEKNLIKIMDTYVIDEKQKKEYANKLAEEFLEWQKKFAEFIK